ncbi:MAG: GGDEF domain-containing protein [Bacilli bacterium]|nr:GGDEF domain-containing protein [Bacilli bacterium]
MKKKLIIIIPILIALITFIFVYRYYNKEDGTTSLTVVEKKWVEDNKKNAIDFEIINDYPLYGMNGDGVFFDFIKDFEKNVGLEFNKIPYLKESTPTTNSYRIRILDNETKLKSSDLLIFVDNYIAIGKSYQRINRISDMKNLKFGVFEQDSEELSYYLKSGTNLSFVNYKSIGELYTALDNGSVDMIIVPNIMYLDRIIGKSEYSINYYFTEMTKKVVLTLSNDNKELNKIISKYYNKWKETNYIDEYNQSYLDYYVEKNELSDKVKTSLVSKTYVYGYIDNPPYESKNNNGMVGIAGEYINRISRLTDIEFKFKKYKNIDKLKKAIDKGEVDVYFDYYNYSNKKYLSTISTFIENYVVLGKEEDGHIVNSFESLKDKEIVMLKNDSLYNYFENNSRSKITKCKNIDELLSLSSSKIIVLDREVYNYNKEKFNNYNVLYIDTIMNDYKFMVKSNNKAFYNLMNYIINTNSYYNYRNSGVDNLNESLFKGQTFKTVYEIVLLIIFIPLIALGLIYVGVKRSKKRKQVKKIDRHKYTDMLTSLKNRNYLNAKMPEWEESNIYPQAVVIVDLNKVKYVNDNYGHNEGDNLIIKAASLLVNTQLENSEIIRTDGNEFLIYLIGYSERQVSVYCKKISKEMKNLPHEFGAAIGFSMIDDSIKTIDDAINEATLDMINSKEDFK